MTTVTDLLTEKLFVGIAYLDNGPTCTILDKDYASDLPVCISRLTSLVNDHQRSYDQPVFGVVLEYAAGFEGACLVTIGQPVFHAENIRGREFHMESPSVKAASNVVSIKSHLEGKASKRLSNSPKST